MQMFFMFLKNMPESEDHRPADDNPAFPVFYFNLLSESCSVDNPDYLTDCFKTDNKHLFQFLELHKL